ncbi:MAG TPA: CBS domain-containing protein [Mycobacteriales bacterium]|nr:CBS domain-containing protein [Mycobacteriales bacterium]
MTTAPARVFAARLAGLPVFDPNGDPVGRVRDLVATLRTDAPPRVVGLIAEVQRRRIFIAMSRVRGIDAGTVVLRTATLSLRGFEKRPGEVLALTELLDRRITRVDDATPVTVVDLGIELTRTADWLVTKVAVRAGRGRRAAVEVLDWDEVTGFTLEAGTQGAANLLAAFEKLNAPDLARVLADLPDKRRAEVAAALDDERLADVLEELSEDDQVEVLAALDDERAADVLEEMAPDDAADLLNELPDDERERLLNLMEPEEAEGVRELLAYEYATAGGLMTNEPIILPPNATVAEALARVRQADLPPSLAAQVYVTRAPTETPTGRFLGTAHFQRLLREPPSQLVSAVVDKSIDPLEPADTLEHVTRHLASYNLVAAPVVDDTGRLLGTVTVDDVLDHLLPANWREHSDGA